MKNHLPTLPSFLENQTIIRELVITYLRPLSIGEKPPLALTLVTISHKKVHPSPFFQVDGGLHQNPDGTYEGGGGANVTPFKSHINLVSILITEIIGFILFSR